ncbi:MAG: ankyrin repeat domain-containing protein [Wolbachia endosymbiont of Homalodisca vitripennis]|nr:ankyrin repeat domain-containing protein [Wolbachia endosymbiont of Homalodisca vitripennis]MCJ7453863.1 ankyrin repeat domain-containing protein [Wolbachia endosymbiont of Homalodisca vitripennis]MCJ7475402.1 ankyrin repeat domain-containing protein [Wolbachia endosymbiont of Homalodisca vitripennis]
MKFKTNSEYDKSKNLDLDAKDSTGYAPLHKAVFSRRFDEVKLLIDKGARVDVQDKHELTPLFYAVMNNDEKMIKFLVEIGNADVNLGKYNNPLGMAISLGRMELAEYLIDKGADINRQDNIGRTFLHKAAEGGNLAAVKFLVEKGARLDVLDKWNDTPLHVAANVKVNKGHIEVVDYLVKNGADINLTHNYTPIHLAITRGNLDMVKCLIDNGADLYIKRACDGTPLTYAKQQGQVEIVNYMDGVMSNLSRSKTVSLDNTNINIKYDLAANKLDTIEKSIKDAVRDFKGAFNTSDHDIRINAYVFNTQNEFKEYLKKVGFDAGDGVNGYTRMIDLNKGNAADVYVYLDSKGNLNQHTLEHEIGHAMHFANLGLSYILPKAMHEAIANYVAGLENGKHINDHGDKEALIAIKNKNLKLDEILRNDYQGNHYYSEAEQVVKFLEHKHPDLIDSLLKSLSTYKRYHDRDEGKKLVEDFLTELKGYTQEFKQWVKAELSGEQHMEYNVVESNSVESSTSQQSEGRGIYGYSLAHHVSGDKNKIESISREDNIKKASADEQGKAVTTKVMQYNKQPFLKVNIDDNNVGNTIGKVNEINKVTSLHFAASLGDLSKVAMLLKHNSYTDTRDHNGQTPLHYAIQSGNTEVAKYLIDHGANLNVHDNYYQKTNTKYVYYKTPLHYAIESGNIEIAKYLIDRGANPNIQDAYSKTPLYSAIYSGNTEIVNYLLDHNADPNSKSYYTFPLLAAIKLGNAEIVKSLIEHGADLGIKNTSAQTLLHYAIELKHTEIAKYLIDRGIDVDTRDISSGKSPLHFAMHMKNMEVVKYLIEHNADIDIQDSYGLTPLHLAVDLGNKKMIEQLVEKGANINAQDNDGWTPLVHAVRHGKLDTIEYLIKNKADVDVVGKDGRTLVEHAELWAEEKGLGRDVIDSKGDNDSYYRELSKEAATWEKAGKDMLSYLKKITMQEEESNDIDQMPADQPANGERNKRSLIEDEEKQEETIVIDDMKEESQHPLKIKVGEAIGDGKYKAVLQAQDQDIDNFYQNLSSQYTAGKYNYNQMIALYNKVYVQDFKLDGKPITLSEAYVTNDHLFIKNQDFGILNDFNEMFYTSNEFM